MTLQKKKRDHIYTYGDYMTWPDDQRWELIEGVADNMSPAPSRKHQDISREIMMQIARFLEDKPYRIYAAPFDVRLPEKNENEEDIRTVVQPDLVVCEMERLDAKGCLGPPEMVIEILSPATSVKDKKDKFILYEKHLVKEYWIVDPSDNTIMVFRLGTSNEYGKPAFFTRGETITTPLFKGLAIELEPVFSRV